MADLRLSDLTSDPTGEWPQAAPRLGWPGQNASEAAAFQLSRKYQPAAQTRAGTGNQETLADLMIPKEPWQYGMYALPGAGGLIGKALAGLPTAARIAMLAGGAALTADQAEAGPLDKIVKAGGRLLKYPMAPRERWYGDANYQQTGGRIVNMTPDEFLAKARPLKVDDVSRENIDDLKRHIQEKGELDPLAIYKNGKEDGRHRAIASKELGIDRVPVLIWDGN